MNIIENEIQGIAERIILLRKQLSNATHKKRILLAELKQLSNLEDQLKIKLEEEQTREKVLLDIRTPKLLEGDTLLVKLNREQTEIISIPLDTVEQYSYPDIICMSDADPNNIRVEFEEVHLCIEQNVEQYIACQDVIEESTTLGEYPENYVSHDVPSASLHANHAMVAVSTTINNSEVDAIVAAITSTIESSTWQNEDSYSNTANDTLPVLKDAKKFSLDAAHNRSSSSMDQDFSLNAAERHRALARGRLVCSICNKEFQRFLRFKSHMHTHSKEPAYGCSECGLKFVTPRRYHAHMRKHTGVKPFACDECGKCFALRYSLTNHLKLHTGQFDHLCTVCGKGYIDNAGLKQHMTTHTLKYSCDVCGKRFANLQAVVNHKFMHTDDCPFVCNVCGHAVKTSKGLNYHMNTHNELKSHACDLCDSRFHQVGHLKSHMRTHTGEKAFACKECSMTFSNGYKLKLHLMSHSDVEQKMFACSECDKKFVVSGSLKAHLLTHSSDTPYQCDKCDKQYKRPFDLRMHRVKVHRGLLTPAELANILPKRSFKDRKVT